MIRIKESFFANYTKLLALFVIKIFSEYLVYFYLSCGSIK